MTLATLKTTCLLLLLLFTITGCSGGGSSSDYTSETTVKDEKQVVAGLVYGNTGKELSQITGEGSSALQIYTSIESGQYAITNYPVIIARENIFSATFTDGSSLYSVWSGVPTPVADVTVTYNQQGTLNPSFVNVSPDNFAARANINPITDLAYWYWLYDKQQSPYYYYQTSVFLFFMKRYNIPEQDAVHDYPSPELLSMFKEIQIKLSANKSEFSLINNSTGNTICTATFAQFPICN